MSRIEPENERTRLGRGGFLTIATAVTLPVGN